MVLYIDGDSERGLIIEISTHFKKTNEIEVIEDR